MKKIFSGILIGIAFANIPVVFDKIGDIEIRNVEYRKIKEMVSEYPESVSGVNFEDGISLKEYNEICNKYHELSMKDLRNSVSNLVKE